MQVHVGHNTAKNPIQRIVNLTMPLTAKNPIHQIVKLTMPLTAKNPIQRIVKLTMPLTVLFQLVSPTFNFCTPKSQPQH